ncbi:MAG: thymidine phosphorylase [Vicinamibacterales bacterium]|nr:thymidine phosphorylase [Vicinamibacterales bacterium]
MRSVDIILKKRDGGVLGPDEIEFFVHGVASGSLPDYQASALLMAILLRGMTPEETTNLTDAMIRSGSRLDLSDISGPKVDKHSTGGVGDKSSLVIAPIVAACGALVPMMSGRGLGHTGGTLDKLESIPGFRTNLSIPEMKASLAAVGCALIGQSSAIAPADKKLYALRDVTGTIESIPLISASIMSKKIAEGTDALVLDVKTGAGAFMKTHAEARALAESLVRIGKSFGVKTQAVITAMDWPIGRAVGNANEVIESIETLKGRGPVDLVEGSLDLAERMLVSAGVASDRAGAKALACRAIDSGSAVEKFKAIIERQGGDPRVVDDYSRLPKAPKEHVVTAPSGGFVTGLDAGLIGRASVMLGGGRDTAEDAIDPGVGIIVVATVGDAVQKGDAILRLHYRDAMRLQAALPLIEQGTHVGPVRRPAKDLIVDEVV